MIYNRVKEKVNRRLEMVAKTEINGKNLIKGINNKVIPLRELIKCNMLWRQSTGERLDLKRDAGRQDLKSPRDVLVKTKLRVACYMVESSNIWIKATWKRELLEEENETIT